jgi:uncharacterized protein (DUF4415 family)
MKKANTSTSSRRGSRPSAKRLATIRKIDLHEPFTERQLRQIAAARRRGLQPKDLEQIPELSAAALRSALRGLHNPSLRKQQLTVRLDQDVFDWLRGFGKGYQTKLNGILRQIMLAERGGRTANR